MYSSTYRFTLDLHSTVSQISLPVTIGDTNRAFNIRLADGGLPYTIEDGCVAMITIKRPGGTALAEFCPVERNTLISYNFSQNPNTAAEEGIHTCEIILYDSKGDILASPWFTMIVTGRAAKKDDLPISEENKTFIDGIVTEELARREAELARDKSEKGDNLDGLGGRMYAETQRKVAEANRAKAELGENLDGNGGRVGAEKARVSAENERKTTFEQNESERQATFDQAEEERNTSYGASENQRDAWYQSAEGTRNEDFAQNETQRQKAENARVEAEKKRSVFYKDFNLRITQIENHIDPKYFITLESKENSVVIPSNACPYIQLNSIGGYGGNGQNLLNPDLLGLPVNYEEEDLYGQIFYPGDYTYVESSDITLGPGTYTLTSSSYSVYLSGVPDCGSPSNEFTFTLEETTTFRIVIPTDWSSDVEYSGWLALMLNEGDYALPFEPFVATSDPQKVTAIEICRADSSETVIATYYIPEAIQNLAGYGYGTVDFINKKFIQYGDENGALPTPIENDIAADLGDFENIFEVQAGGKVKFVTENDVPVHNSITYLAKEGSI